jgi:hypothetical protein
MMGTVKGEIAYEYSYMKLEHGRCIGILSMYNTKNLRYCIKSWRVYHVFPIISRKVDS